MSDPGLLLSFYGDDFTGSTDAMESLARAGVRTVHFTDPPSRAQLSRHPGIRAFGVAGLTRSMPPDEMERTLRPAFESLRATGAPIVHYKVCSTFDSSPTVGSIGRAIDVGMEVFGADHVPVVAGAPSLGRYCAFGNLFARVGTASDVFRLDRHPSMSRHPVTPMDEADLRSHLGKQTAKPVALLDTVQVDLPRDRAMSVYRDLAAGAPVVLIDLMREAQLATVGALIERSPFVVGSSGVGSALTAYWRETGRVPAGVAGTFDPPGDAGPIVVVCGSCSPVTASQIRWATSQGFAQIVFDVTGDDPAGVTEAASASLRNGKNVVIHTGMGAAEKRVDSGVAKSIGPALGRILRDVIGATNVRRVIVAGGDTSGQVARALGIESMEMIAELTRGSPLCRATAPNSSADGLQITFKGGQIGPIDFFESVRRGDVK
jgi:3-oxoisoapionate kinase